MGGFVMYIFKYFLILLFCIMTLTCSKTEEQSDELNTESAQTDTVSVDSVLDNLEKNTHDLKKKAEEVKKEVEELIN